MEERKEDIHFVSGLESGRVFVVDGYSEDLDGIEFVAYALSGINRFNGQTNPWESVAEHSVYASNIAEMRGYDEQVQTFCLLHDASEIITNDVPHPVKQFPLDRVDGIDSDLTLGDVVHEIEGYAMDSIYQNLGIRKPNKAEEEAVKLIDLETTALEVEFLLSDEAQRNFYEIADHQYVERLNDFSDIYDNAPDIVDFDKSASHFEKRYVKRFQELN